MLFKNRIFLPIALLACLLANSSNAQPITEFREDRSHSFKVSFHSGISSGLDLPTSDGQAVLMNPDYKESGVGLNNLSGSFGYSNQLIQGMEVGGSVKAGASSRAKLFNENSSNAHYNGTRLDFEFMFRYLHPVSDDFDLGGSLFIDSGWWWANKASTVPGGVRKNLSDLTFKIGPSANYKIIPNLSLYASALYRFNLPHQASISVNGEKIQDGKLYDLQHGVNIPIGLSLQLTDLFGLYVEANTRIDNFSDVKNSFKEELSLGLNLVI